MLHVVGFRVQGSGLSKGFIDSLGRPVGRLAAGHAASVVLDVAHELVAASAALLHVKLTQLHV